MGPALTGFGERGGRAEEAGVHQTGVHQTVGGVEHPDGDGHGEDG